jgi:hypothetical protein
MKNSERGKFEDAWHKAFDNAEQTPSEDVWTGVELGLSMAETVVMKRRVVFYQRLAAASILFALMLGALGTYYISDMTIQQEQNLAQENLSGSAGGDKDIANSDAEITNEEAIDTNKPEVDLHGNANGSKGLKKEFDNAVGHNDVAIVSAHNDNDEVKDSPGSKMYMRKEESNRNYPSLIAMIPEPSTALNGSMREVVIVRKLPAMPSSLMTSRKVKQTQESLWASLGASTGNYSPSSGFSSGSSSRALSQTSTNFNNGQSAYSTTSSKGSAYSVGMNVGKRIAKRWLLQGGVSYLNQAIGYTSNYAVVDVNNKVSASVADYSSINSSSSVVALSSPYEINSVNEFISIPVQAGYLLVDRKIGLQVNSGLSTDFFMQNTLTDKSGQLASYSSGAGEESPYRSVSLAGLVGTELSYKISTHYRVSVAPGLRYSLNSVLKSNEVSSNPLVWDVGFRFRYIFK